MNKPPAFGFVLEYVSDIEAAKRYYVETLGLEVERTHPVFVQFTDHFAIASDESLSGTRAPETYWLVDDIESVFQDLSPKAEIIFPPRQFPFGKVFAIQDPAGQPFFLLEFARERPSRPVK